MKRMPPFPAWIPALGFACVPALGCVAGDVCADSGTVCLSSETALRVNLGFDPDALVSADLDGDGHGDLIGASEAAGGLTVVWGGGPPEAATSWTIDVEVAGVVVADVDGDGRLDLMTALPQGDAIAVLRGRGGRSFAAPERYPTGLSPRSLVAAELDGQAPLEVVTANGGEGTVSVLRRLVAEPPIVVGAGPRGLAAGDLDGDGDVDLAVALADADVVQVLVGDGAGGLAPGPLHAVGAAPYAVVAADLDDDGRLDLATADSLSDEVSVLRSDGAGGHRGREAFTAALQPTGLLAMKDETGRDVLGVLSRLTSSVARLDPRDGQVRAVATTAPAAAIAVDPAGELVYAGRGGLLGTLVAGDGLRMTPLWDAPSVSGAWPIDVDGDGLDEVAVLEYVGEEPRLVLWPDGPSSASVDLGYPIDAEEILAADVTGDGRSDAIVRSFWRLEVLAQQADGTLLRIKSDTLSAGNFAHMAIGDGDGDGRTEILIAHTIIDTAELRWWRSDDTGLLTRGADFEVPFEPIELHLVDGDGDARADVLVRAEDGAYHYYEDSEPTGRTLGWPDADALSVAFGDLDGDGDLDAVACLSAGSLVLASDVLSSQPPALTTLRDGPCTRVALIDLTGDGTRDLLEVAEDVVRTTFTPWVRRVSGWTPLGSESVAAFPPSSLAFAQLDGDGAPDLLARDEETRELRAHRMALEPALVEVPGVSFGGGRLHLADVDGDGAADLVVAGDDLGFALADGRGGFEPLQRRTLAATLGVVAGAIDGSVVADFDGDGRGELVVALSEPSIAGTTLHRLHLSEARFVGAAIATVALNELTPSAGDVDGDGVLDLVAVTEDKALHAVVLHGRKGGGFAEPIEVVAQSPGTIWNPQLVDFDRDGVLDLLIASYDGILLYPDAGPDMAREPVVVSPMTAFDQVVGDFDGDRHTDLIAFGAPGNGDQLLLMRGGASGSPQVLLDEVTAIEIADLDRDGRPELIVTQNLFPGPHDTGALRIGRPDADGRFVFTRQDVPIESVRRILTADIDADGDLDIGLVRDQTVTFVEQAP